MLPGDVYYYSSNSLVLCVQQNLEKEEEPDPQVRLGPTKAWNSPHPSKPHNWDIRLLFEKFIYVLINESLSCKLILRFKFLKCFTVIC